MVFVVDHCLVHTKVVLIVPLRVKLHMATQEATRQWDPSTVAQTTKTKELVAEAVEAQFQARVSRQASIGKVARRAKDERASKEYRTVEALVLDTLAHSLSGMPEHLVIKLDNNWLSAGPEGALARNRTVIDRLYDLEEAGWLRANRSARINNKYMTVLSVGRELGAACERLGIKLNEVGVEPTLPVIELRGYKPKGAEARRPILKFEPTACTEKMLRRLGELNDCLRAADLQGKQLGTAVIDVRCRSVSRAFLDGSFERGGRLTGPAFWLSLRKVIRREGLCIDGEAIVEVDIGAAMPSIAYALEGVRPTKDPYSIADCDDIPRDAIKVAMMQMLWKPIKSGTNLADGARALVPKKYTAGQVFEAIRQHNKPIAHRLGAREPCGAELMWHESEIIIEATLRCFDAGIAALPLHDALLTACSRAQEASGILSEVFQDRLGIEPTIKVQSFASNAHGELAHAW